MSESPFFIFGQGKISQVDEASDWACIKCGRSLLKHGTHWRWTDDGKKIHSDDLTCLPREGADDP